MTSDTGDELRIEFSRTNPAARSLAQSWGDYYVMYLNGEIISYGRVTTVDTIDSTGTFRWDFSPDPASGDEAFSFTLEPIDEYSAYWWMTDGSLPVEWDVIAWSNDSFIIEQIPDNPGGDDQGGDDQSGNEPGDGDNNDPGGDNQGGNDQGGNDQGGDDQGGNDQGGDDGTWGNPPPALVGTWGRVYLTGNAEDGLLFCSVITINADGTGTCRAWGDFPVDSWQVKGSMLKLTSSGQESTVTWNINESTADWHNGGLLQFSDPSTGPLAARLKSPYAPNPPGILSYIGWDYLKYEDIKDSVPGGIRLVPW